ncbi:protease HtpX [Spiribacter vilamensis]|uniref:Protease HtpX n=1 Tax=Spiribacter vilamensis TaxID=531306 RepID=A0A4Q8CYK0_9GAMM|nr:protease HtpX [Spiribacter vilamensis]RZU97970.1 heat shock protein [Spiribacter vilamensis]TVO61116.1 protease HtpX [Spiribacter vilamensis]
MKRVLLFLGTNIAIILVLGTVLRLLGVDRLLEADGGALDYGALLIFAAVFGMGGSFLSLAISKWMAKKAMGVRAIDKPSNARERWLVETVKRQATTAGVGMPEVGIYDSPQVNAFATGMSRNNALVAVSSGLLETMSADEAEAVLAHEVMHVQNGDMITLALIQGVVNTFVIFFARVIGHFVDRVILKNERGHGIGFWVTTIVAEIMLAVLASVIVMWFSRQREFRADAGAADLAGREKMIAALQRLGGVSPADDLPDQMEAFGISGRIARGGFKRYFMSHPPIEARIEALRRG